MLIKQLKNAKFMQEKVFSCVQKIYTKNIKYVWKNVDHVFKIILIKHLKNVKCMQKKYLSCSIR